MIPQRPSIAPLASPVTSTTRPARNLGIDLLRLVAVLLVFGRHVRLPEDAGLLLRAWQRGGWIGVDLFFVLSGFLVSSILFTEYRRSRVIDVKRFLIRRGFKIYPAFWLLLATTALVRYHVLEVVPATSPFVAELLFVQNYLDGVWYHTWSLAVEEHFYLAIALLFAMLARSGDERAFDRVPRIFLLVAAACLALRVLTWLNTPEFSARTHLYGTHLRVDSLFFGTLLAYLHHFRDLELRVRRVPAPALLGCGALLLSPAFIYPVERLAWVSVAGVVLLYLGSGLLLLAAMRLQHSASHALRLGGRLGAASYSIYLWHVAVGTWGSALLDRFAGDHSFALYLTTFVGGSLAVGWMMNRLLENPVLVLRDAAFPTESPSRRREAPVPVEAGSVAVL